MSVFRTSPSREPRHLQMCGGGTIALRVDNELLKRVMSERATRNEEARQRQFRESVGA